MKFSRRNSLLLVVFSLMSSAAFGQRSLETIPTNFTELQYLVQEEYAVPTGHLVSIKTSKEHSGPFLSLLTIDGTPYVADLKPVTTRAKNYEVLAEGANGKKEYRDGGLSRTIRGNLVGIPGSRVAGSLMPDGLHLRVQFAKGDVYWIEPVKRRIPTAETTHYVVYNDNDVRDCGGRCGNATLMQRFFPATSGTSNSGSSPPTSAVSSGNLKVCQIACEADFEFYEEFGSVSAVEDQINNIINAVNDQYEAEVGITYEISKIIVQTDADDPYDESDASDLLNQFRDHWKSENEDVDRDVAKLFTGRDLDGDTIGIAFVGVICSDFAYLLVESTFTSNFSCLTDLSAHEMGHTWDANHCGCSDHTMNASLTCKNTFHPTKTIPEIEAFRDSISCLGQGESLPDAGSSDCPNGQITDCFGNCIPLTFLGDGICDDGSFDFEGIPMFFDCPLYDCDYGDCDCGNSQAYGTEGKYDSYKIQKGKKISSQKSKIEDVDNKYSKIDSKSYGNKQKVQTMVRIESSIDPDQIERIDASIELYVDTADTTCKVYLYNEKDGKWKDLEKIDLRVGFNRIQLLDIKGSSKYVSDSSKIKMKLLIRKKTEDKIRVELDRMAVITYEN